MPIVLSAIHRLLAQLNGVDWSDDRGVDESPSKMLWIAAAIIIAGLATAFAIQIYNEAQSTVPSPAVPGG